MYTKGPWKNAPDMRGIGNIPVVGIVDPDGNAIANLGTQGADNARLICAAPDLLEALQALTATARTFRNVSKREQEWTPLDDEALDAAFAAIVKATGSQS